MLVVPKSIRKFLIVALPILTLFEIWNIPRDAFFDLPFAGFVVHLIKFHDYTLIFANAFALAALAAGIFALKHHKKGEIVAAYIYASCAIGITFTGDLLSLFLMWEIMAVASTIIILYGGTDKARKAAYRYAVLHFFGGALLIASLACYYNFYNTIDLIPLKASWRDWLTIPNAEFDKIASWALLIAILINVAAPPFSSWLADSYPESSPWGGVFLSAFTTKTAVFVLLTEFAGQDILIPIGIFMIFYGIIWAMLENNLRRILSYSIVNQVGFMVVGIGIGTPLALAGVGAHAFCHIMYKGLLFMSAGAVITQTGKHKCTEVGGLFRTMKFTTIAGIVGALAISAFPLTSGFVSKSLITSASANEHMMIVWMFLVAASAGVFLHAGVKFPWFAFFQKDSGLRPKEAPFNMRFAMGILIVLCILPGIFPQYLYAMLPIEIDYEPNTSYHIIYQLQLLLFAGFAFFAFLPLMKRTETISLDWDFLTRVFGLGAIKNIEKISKLVSEFALRNINYVMKRFEKILYKNFNPIGRFSVTWKISDTVFYTTIMLAGFILIYFFR